MSFHPVLLLNTIPLRLIQPWPVGSVGWSVILYTKSLWVLFLVRTHTLVAGSIPGQGTSRRQLIHVSLSHWYFSRTLIFLSVPLLLSLPLSLQKINKHILGEDLKNDTAQFIYHCICLFELFPVFSHYE